MKILIDVKDRKANFMLELLNSFSFVKSEPITPVKAGFLKELKGAVNEVSLAVEGKIKLQSAKDFLKEV